MVGQRILPLLVVLLTAWLGAVPHSAAEYPCQRIGGPGAPTSGWEEVCQKPAGRKSWGQLFADYFGYRGYKKSYALVVGISNYTGGYNDLPTERDTLKVRDFLIHEADFDYVHVLTDGRATIERIRELMIDLFPDRVDTNDRFLFYWSGHGVTRGRNGFLPVADTPKAQYSKMISMDNIQQWDRYVQAKQSLFLLDACFGGLAGVAHKSPTTDRTIRQLARPSHHLLTAGTEKEEAIAGDRWQGSLFTAALLDGLRGEADTASRFQRDGVVSLRELMVYMQKRVAIETDQVGWNRSLTPQLRDLRSSDGEFFFLTPQSKRETISQWGVEPSATFMPKAPERESPGQPFSPEPLLPRWPPQEPQKPFRPVTSFSIDHDNSSRYLAPQLEEYLRVQNHAVVRQAEGAPQSLKLILRSTVANDTAYRTKITRMTVQLTVQDNIGNEVLQQTQIVQGSSRTDYEQALQDAALTWISVMKKEGVMEKILRIQQRDMVGSGKRSGG